MGFIEHMPPNLILRTALDIIMTIGGFIGGFFVYRWRKKYDARMELEDSMVAEERSEKSAQHDILISSARLTLLKSAKYHKARGFCPLEEKEILTKLYNAYKNMHGNGIIDAEYAKTMMLPNEKEEV